MANYFEDRIVEHPGRITLTAVSGQTNTYDVTPAEGAVTQAGTPLNADNMEEAVGAMISDAMQAFTISNALTVTFKNIQSGKTTITPVANTVTQKTINFNTEFENVPNVVATAQTAAPQNVSVGIDQISKTSFRISIYRTNTTSTVIQWFAYGS